MKTIKFWALSLCMIGLFGCDDDLDLLPLDRPSDENFFSTAKELDLAINGVYNDLYYSPFQGVTLQFHLENLTDIGWDRDGSDFQATGRGGHAADTPLFNGVWSNFYQAIARCNLLLTNMDRAIEDTPEDQFNRIRSEARFFRAFYYHHLVMLYGDVPLLTEPQDLNSPLPARTPRAEIISFIINELTEAAPALPVNATGADTGRITQATALTLKARMALYDSNWQLASDTAQEVMNLGSHSLHPNFGELFTYAGESSPETLLAIRYDQATTTHLMAAWIYTRLGQGFVNKIPVQALVDSFECTDGLQIDQSPLYDPANPFENRDPRLDFTVVRSGVEHRGFIFESHPDSVETFNVMTDPPTRVENTDVTNPFASFSGYAWKKYADEPRETRFASALDFIMMRYAEVLLIYAEAKIELGQADASVLDAINQVRARAYSEEASYPEVTTTNVDELRTILRRERKVELAQEGFRLYDLRRWGLLAQAVPGVLVGRPQGAYSLQGIPVFDEDGFPDYSAYQDILKLVDTKVFNAGRDELWPIPQQELDLNDRLVQNPGY